MVYSLEVFLHGSPPWLSLLPTPRLRKAINEFFLGRKGLLAGAEVNNSTAGGTEFRLDDVDVCELLEDERGRAHKVIALIVISRVC